VDSDIMTTTVESFDRHFVVNARASWLLVREFARRFRTRRARDHRQCGQPGADGHRLDDERTVSGIRSAQSPGPCGSVRGLREPRDGWINGQLLHGDGGFR